MIQYGTFFQASESTVPLTSLTIYKISGKGEAFTFLAKRGSVNKLLIEFMGGGACFSAVTCSLPEWLPAESATATKLFLETKPGLHNPKQETANWHAIYVPYCTGDGHVGNNTAHYADQTVHHFGGVNARAALKYAYGVVENAHLYSYIHDEKSQFFLFHKTQVRT